MANMLIQPDPAIERRRRLAEALAAGPKFQNVEHWTQGASNIAGPMLSAWLGRSADQDDAQRQTMARETLAQAISESQRPETQVRPIGDDQVSMENFDIGAPQGSQYDRMVQVLMGNPDTRQFGTNLALQQMQQQAATQSSQAERRAQLEGAKALAEFRSQLPGRSGALHEFQQMTEGLSLEDRELARRIKLGLDPRAGMSAQERIATDPALSTQVAESQREIESGKAEGKEWGKLFAQSQANFPQFEATTNEAISLLDKAMNHPGLSYAVGASSMLPVVPGTSGADFMAIHKQITGKNFLQAFESLKGGGAITEIEGQKAEQAIARMDRSQSEGEYVASLNELKGILASGVERKRASLQKVGETAAGGSRSGGGQMGRNRGDVDVDALVNKYAD